MEAFEKQALETSTWQPNLWIRYVDDVFAIWLHGHQHPAIQFTMEKEEDQKIAFLDVQIERQCHHLSIPEENTLEILLTSSPKVH